MGNARTDIGTLSLSTSAFEPNGRIPARYTCDGEDVAPPLSWDGARANTQTFALILDDPDAPTGTFTHWLIWDIPSSAGELAEGTGARGRLTSGAAQGQNDFGEVGYRGPCPPPGKPHHYHFTLYALSASLRLSSGVTRRQVQEAIEQNAIARAELVGTYSRD